MPSTQKRAVKVEAGGQIQLITVDDRQTTATACAAGFVCLVWFIKKGKLQFLIV